ncbi:MAG: HlyD family secretion protein [Cyanobacteriota bacterium]
MAEPPLSKPTGGPWDSPPPGAFELQRMNPDDTIPSVSPWIRHTSSAMLAGVVLALAFISMAPYRVIVRGYGSVRPTGELVLINAPFEARVAAIHVKTNQTVRLGDAIVSLDRSGDVSQSLQFAQSQQALLRQSAALQSQTGAELATAALEVQKTRSALELALSEYQRYSQLASSGAVSLSMLAEKQARYYKEKASLAQASKRLDEIQSKSRSSQAQLEREQAAIIANLGEAQRRVVNATVRSPVEGVVFKLEVRNPMQTVSAGQKLASIAPSQAEMVAKVAVQGEDVDLVVPGQRADLRLQACPFPDFGTLPARVMAISPDALPAQSEPESSEVGERPPLNGLYEVTLRLEKRALQSRSRRCVTRLGMALNADITTKEESVLSFVLRKTRLWVGS